MNGCALDSLATLNDVLNNGIQANRVTEQKIKFYTLLISIRWIYLLLWQITFFPHDFVRPFIIANFLFQQSENVNLFCCCCCMGKKGKKIFWVQIFRGLSHIRWPLFMLLFQHSLISRNIAFARIQFTKLFIYFSVSERVLFHLYYKELKEHMYENSHDKPMYYKPHLHCIHNPRFFHGNNVPFSIKNSKR